MYDTRLELSPTEMKRASTGYFRKNEPQDFVNFNKGYITGPTVISTVNDMLKYLQANLSEKNKAVQLTHKLTWGRKDGFGMGLGWMMDSENGVRYIYHDGNTRLGFNTFCIFYPTEDFGVIIFVNDNIGLSKVGEIENRIRKEIEGKY
jgi:CubicO group peptidase (beta-lactamase class C family)